MKPKEYYLKRRDSYHRLQQKQSTNINIISNLRLLVFACGIIFTAVLYIIKLYYIAAAVLIIFLTAFIYLVVKHRKLIDNSMYSSIFYKLNDDSIKRSDGGWKTFSDDGSDLFDEEHNYAADLDIFGQGSLFQWTGIAVTFLGRQKLKETFTECPKSVREIYMRQEAVKELAPKLWWRQRFTAEGLRTVHKMKNPEVLLGWAAERNELYGNPYMVILFRMLPVVTILLTLSAVIFSKVFLYPAVIAIGTQIVMVRKGLWKRASAFDTAAGYKKDVYAYTGMLRLIENRNFNSTYLNQLKSNMLNNKKETAFKQVEKLAKIIDSISNRNNAFYVVFNIMALWDYQCMIALESWKRESGAQLSAWLYTIAEFEALASLSIIRFDHPEWAMPEVKETPMELGTEKMGHPLLPESRVYNDLSIRKPAGILLITGSNMSGKSTLLRTAGINLVLAYAGAPVCAQSFHCSIMDIYTCMRVSDNLEKNISSFYAELVKIRKIVEAVRSGGKVFFLLDEIFKGTNSLDRHTGARVLINMLSREGAIGMVSTHDLELGTLEEESSGRILNFHFREYYDKEGIHFDYKLRPGISTTRNAMYLMKMAGIDPQEIDRQMFKQ